MKPPNLFLALLVFLCPQWVLAWHRDYVYDLADESPQEFQDRKEEREKIKTKLANKYSSASFANCQSNELPYNISSLESCDPSFSGPKDCNVSFPAGQTGDNLKRSKVYKTLVKLAKDSVIYHTKFIPNMVTIVVKSIPLLYFILLCLFTSHFSKENSENPRLLDGSSVNGQRYYVYNRPKFTLWDGSVKPARLVGLIQKVVLWRDNVEGANDWEIAHKYNDSGFSPVPGTNFHIAANIPIPELDEDELTEAQALKRRIKRYGVMTKEQFRYNVEQIHARRLVLTAGKEYQQRVIERGAEPLFDAHREAQESMDCALKWSREERIANQLRIEAERRERDKTIDIHWEKSNKTFRDHRQRMRDHQEKVDKERAERVKRGLPAIGPDQLDLLS